MSAASALVAQPAAVAAGRIRSLVLAPFFDLQFVNNRPRTVAEVLATFGDVDVVTTDFDHALKASKPRQPWAGARHTEYVPTPRYAHNVSPRRFWSHVAFSRRALDIVRARRGAYDVIYATVPFNLLAAGAFADAGPALRVLDVVDVWPDVLPFSPRLRQLGRPAFAAWKALFLRACRDADVVLAVSDTFLTEARRTFRGPAERSRRVYIAHPALDAGAPQGDAARPASHAGAGTARRLRLAYVGNLGHLYDFETLLVACDTPALRGRVQLDVIGRGDREAWLRSALEQAGVPTTWHGVVTDPDALAAVLGRCDAGFNGFANTSAAFSYKATTYLAAGLPLVNSMGGDLHRLVAERGLGENYAQRDPASLATALGRVLEADAPAARARCAQFFREELETSVVHAQLRAVLGAPIAAQARARRGG